jgi:hypothetical protein
MYNLCIEPIAKPLKSFTLQSQPKMLSDTQHPPRRYILSEALEGHGPEIAIVEQATC